MPTSFRNRPRGMLLIAMLPALAAFLLYLPALQNGFVNWDDDDYVYQNPAVQQLDLRLVTWAFTRFHAANWHPLTWISHSIDVSLWGLDPWGHHLTNILLHALNTFLLVLTAGRLLGMVRRASGERAPDFLSDAGIILASLAAGLLFGLHPLHVESVAWISERKDLLCGLFFLLGLLLYLPGTPEEPAAPPVKRLLPVFGCFAAALLSKPMAVTFPLVLLLIDWYPLNRISTPGAAKKIALEKAPFLLLSLASAVVTVLAQHSGYAFDAVAHMPVPARMLVAAKAYISYLAKLVVPIHLAPLYPYPVQVSAWSPRYFVPALLVAAMAAPCFLRWKLRKQWCLLWGYYAITLLPVIGVVQIGYQSMADRYTYLPSAGPTVAAGLLIAWAWHRMRILSLQRHVKWTAPIVPTAAVVALLFLSSVTLSRIGIWKDSLTLWNSELEAEPLNNPVAHFHRGIAYAQAGMYEPAIRDYDEAIMLKPRYYEAYNNRATLYDGLDQLGPAIRDYTTSLRIKPHFKVYYNRGVTYARMGSYREAIGDFTRSLSLEPDNAGAYVNRGVAYARIGDLQKARQDLDQGCARGNQVGCRMLNEMSRAPGGGG